MIIEGIGGKIKATSEESQGTTMTVYLPLTDQGVK
jgi:signal transduction histidine kinase